MKEDIIKFFVYHPPSKKQIPKYEDIRQQGLLFAMRLDRLCPDGPQKVRAIEKLQECIMWANASIALEKEE